MQIAKEILALAPTWGTTYKAYIEKGRELADGIKELMSQKEEVTNRVMLSQERDYSCREPVVLWLQHVAELESELEEWWYSVDYERENLLGQRKKQYKAISFSSMLCRIDELRRKGVFKVVSSYDVMRIATQILEFTAQKGVEHGDYIDVGQKLANKIEEVVTQKKIVESQVELAEDENMGSRLAVRYWMFDVDAMETELFDWWNSDDEHKGESFRKMTDSVAELTRRGEFDSVTAYKMVEIASDISQVTARWGDACPENVNKLANIIKEVMNIQAEVEVAAEKNSTPTCIRTSWLEDVEKMEMKLGEWWSSINEFQTESFTEWFDALDKLKWKGVSKFAYAHQLMEIASAVLEAPTMWLGEKQEYNDLAEKLGIKIKELKIQSEAVKNRVRLTAEQNLKPTRAATIWLKDMERMEKELSEWWNSNVGFQVESFPKKLDAISKSMWKGVFKSSSASEMIEVAGGIVDSTTLWGEYHQMYIDLGKKLANKIQELITQRQGVQTRLQLEADKNLKPTYVVTSWLEDVEKMETKLCEWWNSDDEHDMSASFAMRLDAITKLVRQGKFESLFSYKNLSSKIPGTSGVTVASSGMLEMVCNCVKDENVGVIGIYGMGCVGKTSLMSEVASLFSVSKGSFDVVIWAKISEDGNCERVQDVILKMYGLDGGRYQGRKNEVVLHILAKKKFLLLLDDVWGRIDLNSLGVPAVNIENKSKIIFTTRSEEVCDFLEASKKIRVPCLVEEDAFDLFKINVGARIIDSSPEITKLAKDIARRCAGLPIALTTIGKYMYKCKMDTVKEWEDVRNYPWVSTIRREVFPSLRTSYDRLSSEILKICFIYCSLFAQDWNINVEELIDLWIWEDFPNRYGDTDVVRDRDEARDQLLSLIKDLMGACLLDKGESQDHFKVHPVLCRMALCIASEHRSEVKYFVKSFDGPVLNDGWVKKLKEAERISLCGTEKIDVRQEHSFPKLLSFYVRDSKLKTLPSELFRSMHHIKVLDLSNNSGLTQLPMEIGTLVLLEYLNLSNTRIKEFPIWIQNLSRLKYLGLDNTGDIRINPKQLGCHLMLQALHMWYVNVYGGFLDTVEKLEHLSDAKITLDEDSDVQKLQSSSRLQRIIRSIQIKQFNNSATSLAFDRFVSLEVLELFHCGYLEKLTFSVSPSPTNKRSLQKLHTVNIKWCDVLRHLTWLIWAPNLRFLAVKNCSSLEEIISIGDSENGLEGLQENLSIFSSLELLELSFLPELRSIYHEPLLLACLKEIRLCECPKLKKLPLDSNSAKNSLASIDIDFAQDELEWGDEAAKHAFLLYVRCSKE